MSVWAHLYAYRDHEALANNESGSGENDTEDGEPIIHWESPHFPSLWRQLGDISEIEREQMGIERLFRSVTGHDEFEELISDGDCSTAHWCPLEGMPECVERLVSLIEQDPSPLEVFLRRTIVTCALSQGPTEAKAQDAAWPVVASQRSDYVAAFAEELRELAETLRQLQPKGETHIILTIG